MRRKGRGEGTRVTTAQARETLQWIADRRAHRTLADALRITADTFYRMIG